MSLTLIIFHAKFQINNQLEKWLPRHYRRPGKKSELREPISVKHREIWNLSRQREKKQVNICLSIESNNFLKSFSRKLWKAVVRDLSLDQKQFQLTMHGARLLSFFACCCFGWTMWLLEQVWKAATTRFCTAFLKCGLISRKTIDEMHSSMKLYFLSIQILMWKVSRLFLFFQIFTKREFPSPSFFFKIILHFLIPFTFSGNSKYNGWKETRRSGMFERWSKISPMFSNDKKVCGYHFYALLIIRYLSIVRTKFHRTIYSHWIRTDDKFDS